MYCHNVEVVLSISPAWHNLHTVAVQKHHLVLVTVMTATTRVRVVSGAVSSLPQCAGCHGSLNCWGMLCSLCVQMVSYGLFVL